MRPLIALCFTLLAAATASAGPLGWTYNVSFLPFGGVGDMLIGMEQKLPFPDANTPDTYMRFFQVREYAPLTGAVADGTWQRLYTFGPETPLTDSSDNRNGAGPWFELDATFTDTAGHTVSLPVAGGTMHIYDFADGETPRFVLTGLTGSPTTLGEQDVTLGDRRARVSVDLGGSEREGMYMRLRVDEEPVASPEPGTLVLAALAVSGALGAWARRKKGKPDLGVLNAPCAL